MTDQPPKPLSRAQRLFGIVKLIAAMLAAAAMGKMS